MNRRHTLALLLALPGAALLPLTAAANTLRRLQYVGEQDGVTSTLTLQVTGESVEGTLEEPDLTLAVRGSLKGTRLEAALREPLTGFRLARVQGELRGDTLPLQVTARGSNEVRTLVMQRVGAAGAAAAAGAAPASQARPGAAAAAPAGAVPAAFVGRWRHQQNINSGGGAGGFASFSTEMTMELAADGRVRQWSRSAGGGSGWSSAGGERPEFSGRWQVRGDELWVQADGQGGFQRASRIRRSGEYLVTEDAQGRRIWQR